MKREFFNRQFMALVSAYTYAQKMPEECQDVYWEMLKAIPEEQFARGVTTCLATCKYFPTIAEIGAAALPPVERQGAWQQTKNGMDRPNVLITWEKQLAGAALEPRRPLPIEGGVQESEQVDKLKRERDNLLDERWRLLERISVLEQRLAEPPKPKPSEQYRRAELKRQAAILAKGAEQAGDAENQLLKELLRYAAPSVDHSTCLEPPYAECKRCEIEKAAQT